MPKIKTVTKKNGEKVYKFQVYTGVHPLTGKESTTTRSFKTKREANRALKLIQAQVEDGSYWETSDASKMTFREVYEAWREGYKNSVEESTLLKNDQIFRSRILPSFGKYQISKITIDMIQTQVNKWKEYSKAGNWVNETSRIFKHAMMLQIIQMNPCDFVVKPKKIKKKKSKEFYTKDELKKFMKANDEWDNLRGKTFLRLLAFTGIRRGEAMALTRHDIVVDKKIIMINKAISRRAIPGEFHKNGKPKTELYLKGTKNSSSERMTTVDEKTLNLLLELIDSHDYKWIFTNRNGNWISPSRPRKWLRKIASVAKLEPIPIHNLRHTHATLLRQAGAKDEEVQKRLGHYDITTTRETYLHLEEEERDTFAKQFSEFIDF